MVGTVSETPPLSTEEILTDHGATVDDVSGVEAKAEHHCGGGFGRVSIGDAFRVSLFPALQARFGSGSSWVGCPTARSSSPTPAGWPAVPAGGLLQRRAAHRAWRLAATPCRRPAP